MAQPNIVNVTSIFGETKGIALTMAGVDILENPAGSNKVYKVGTLYVANIDGVATADATVSFVDATGPLTTKIASTIPVPGDATLLVIAKDGPVYLEEGDKLTGAASADGDLVAVVSYEEIG